MRSIMGFMRNIIPAIAIILLGSASLAFAQLPLPTPTPPLPPPPIMPLPPVPIPLSITGNEVRGTIDLPGDIGADLTISFEDVIGLTSTALEASATLVNPVDPTLIGRLPASVGVPAAFPVLVQIGPSASSALTFSGIYRISFHTHNLQLDPALPLSLLKAPDGGAFQDITRAEGRGSYRDDGDGGGFSEFLIVVDSRPIDTVIAGKFIDLQAILNDPVIAASISPAVLTNLQSLLSQALTLYQSGSIWSAMATMHAFSLYVKAHSGEEIPDVWRANCNTVVNVAGLLRTGADTLKFSLDRKLSH
ncbi:MAG: hypothetical protein DMF80_09660 [Acidobacteria bacterium]|nr:MAG: hypothetical protein DMF80_09660 [Acidobacteriota bacterium]